MSAILPVAAVLISMPGIVAAGEMLSIRSSRRGRFSCLELGSPHRLAYEQTACNTHAGWA